MVAMSPDIDAAGAFAIPWMVRRGYSGTERPSGRPKRPAWLTSENRARERERCSTASAISRRHPLIPMSIVSPPLTAHFAPLATDYDVVLSDVWGVVHNGAVAFAEACDALARFRAAGGTVVLITNAPRPGDTVARLTLDPFG